MTKIVRLRESDLIKLVERVLRESKDGVEEASSPAQQAAIAINMKKKGIKPKNESLYEEEESNAFEEIMQNLDHIANNFDRNTTEEELDFMINQIEYEVESAIRGDELTDDQLDELTTYADFLVDELVSEFRLGSGLNEGTKAKKTKAIRSRRSGIKTATQIKKNSEVLRNLSSK